MTCITYLLTVSNNRQKIFAINVVINVVINAVGKDQGGLLMVEAQNKAETESKTCLLYTSDAADDIALV